MKDFFLQNRVILKTRQRIYKQTKYNTITNNANKQARTAKSMEIL